MPSYVNIGAYVDEGTMVDTWATVGSCAQIGKNVHLSGGVGIGGVLEPMQANPTIIEDNCFIGARSEIVEGVIVEENSVISMGVYIGQSTKIYNRETGEVSYGRIPAGSVVVSGSLPSSDGKYSLYCAVIVKQVDAKTRAKTGINELLRGFKVPLNAWAGDPPTLPVCIRRVGRSFSWALPSFTAHASRHNTNNEERQDGNGPPVPADEREERVGHVLRGELARAHQDQREPHPDQPAQAGAGKHPVPALRNLHARADGRTRTRQ
jgi:carbonic anhydrase/acetyltransferase-like protein (isoleucine patch superfamily)